MAIRRANLSPEFEEQERHKSNLIVEANLLKAQGNYVLASERFAEAADIEDTLATHLWVLDNSEKAFAHAFSALSCWAQAGDLHRAHMAGLALLGRAGITAANKQKLQAYLQTLTQRTIEWMRHWHGVPPIAAD
ncbi:MAG: hypothetical protein OT477_00350 [Chloroflexi bacterium]|nr:hypothetical protein [Chloroflexota bacterium]